MRIMPSREQGLRETLAGYEETGMPLVAYDGQSLGPAGFSDDVGLYELVPRLARGLGLSVEQAIDVFFIGMMLAALAVGLLGCLRYFRSWWLRGWIALLLFLVALSCLRHGDVYIVPACLAIALVPWHLSFVTGTREGSGAPVILFAFLAGVVLGGAHFVRHQSATPVLLFMALTLVAARERPVTRRLLLLGLIAAGFLLPVSYFQWQLARRDAYLASEVPGYEAPLKRHPLWHSVYIGLGFLENDHGIRYLDEVATAKVRELAPDAGYLSEEYESALRGEVARIARQDPLFVVKTVVGKLWTLAGLLLLWANVGLVAAVARPRPLSLHAGFWLALALAALPGVLVMPYAKYVLGYIAFAVLYGVAALARFTGAGDRQPFIPFASR